MEIRISMAIAFCIVGLASLVCFFIAFEKQRVNKFAIQIAITLGLSSLANLLYFGATISTDPYLFRVLTLIVHVCLLWIVNGFLNFLMDYCKVLVVKPARIVLYVILALDSLAILSNIFYPWIGDAMKDPATEGFFAFNLTSPFLYFHYALGFSLGAICVYITIKNLITAPKIYKYKYSNLLVLMAVACVTNIIFLAFDEITIDFSVLVYGILMLENMYHVLIKSSKKLARSIDTLIVKNTNLLIIVFDENGDYFFSNKICDKYFDKKEFKIGRDEFLKKYVDIPADSKLHFVSLFIDDKRLYFKAKNVQFADKKNRIQGYYVMLNDVTNEIEQQRKNEFITSHDTLTKAYNRVLFEKTSNKMIDNSVDKNFLIIATNFEHFRLYNELYGQKEGDKVLIKLSDFLMNFSTKHRTIFARMGSDRFAICILEKTYNEEKLAEQLIKLFEPYEEKNLFLKLGVTKLDPDEDIFSNYERAVQTIHFYREKLNDRVGFYSEKIKEKLLREHNLIKLFDESIEKEYFEVYLQPQVNSRNESIFGAEALTRWIHPDLGFVSPGEFIPIFERAGIIHKLDLYIWEHVFQYLDKCRNTDLDKLSISINISRIDFYHIDVYKEIIGLSEKYNIPRNRVKLEITESAFITDEDKVIKVLSDLKDAGFTIEMDDFGSGYSSLNSLKNFPLNVVKLDMKFLSSRENDAKTIEILSSIISMCYRLRFAVIAEGVETNEQVDMLKGMNCTLIQGYKYSKPLNINDFELFAKDRSILPTLDTWFNNEELLYSTYKEIDKYYGAYPSPIIAMAPIYNDKEELCDLVCIYQNDIFKADKQFNKNTVLGKKVTDLEPELIEKRLDVYRECAKSRRTLVFSRIAYFGALYKGMMYILPDSNYMIIIFDEKIKSAS